MLPILDLYGISTFYLPTCPSGSSDHKYKSEADDTELKNIKKVLGTLEWPVSS